MGKTKSHVDVLIIGQGIAGSFLAHFLEKKGKTVCILSSKTIPNASKAAAGLMQRISGKFLTIPPLIDSCFAESVDIYRSLEQEWGIPLISKHTTIRCLNSIQKKRWKKISKRNLYSSLSSLECKSRSLSSLTLDDSIELFDTYLVNPSLLLNTFYDYFNAKDMYRESIFNPENLTLHPQGISYDSMTSDHLIFCCGSHISELDFFSHIPFDNVKGETLEFYSDHHINSIIQKDHFIVPYGSQHFKIGATYDRKLNYLPTKHGYHQLVDSIQDLGFSNSQILQHNTGIRCFSNDKKPIVGWHPLYKNLGIFGGLGSRGYITAPSLAKQWAHDFPNYTTCLRSCDVTRFCV